jgi:hypothetical protein
VCCEDFQPLGSFNPSLCLVNPDPPLVTSGDRTGYMEKPLVTLFPLDGGPRTQATPPCQRRQLNSATRRPLEAIRVPRRRAVTVLGKLSGSPPVLGSSSRLR